MRRHVGLDGEGIGNAVPDYLLTTKLYVPRARVDAVSRPRLLDRLASGVHGMQRFTLVCGPAGSGKTTLLSQFAAQLERPIVWLSLDEDDNDPVRFWTYLIRACQTVLPGVGQEALSLLQASQMPPAQTLATILINDVATGSEAPGSSEVPSTPGVLVLVLDDYHLIHEQTIHAAVSFLFEHAPRQLHLVLSTRSDPPFALARLRARNQLIEIRERDLRFSGDEVAAFLASSLGSAPAAEHVAALEARTEGWIAGLQLAALALQAPGARHVRVDRGAFIQNFAGSHVYVADYLLEEVLRGLPEATQGFLRQTSILQRLNGDLCDALTGGEEGRTMLAMLQRENLFVIALDDVGQWFRYHHLFADLLQARLAQECSPEEISALHARAARWYERQQLTPEAIRHALAAEDVQSAARLVEKEAHDMMHGGQVRTLQRWLEALPQASVQSHPRLAIFRAWIDLMQGKGYGSSGDLRQNESVLEALPPSPENDRLRLEWTVILCRFIAFAGDTSRAIRLAQEALARLPEDEFALRARAYSTLALATWMAGRPQEATAAYEECMTLANAAGNDSLAAHTTMMRGLELVDYGRLHEAARHYQMIVEMGARPGGKRFFPAGQGYIGLAGVHLEWNDLNRAEAYVQEGMMLCRQGGLPGLDTALAIKARLQQARGDNQEALATAQSLAQALPGGDPALTVRLIKLYLASGDVDEAWRVAMPLLTLLEGAGDERQAPLLLAEILRVVVARVLLARGEEGRAMALLDAVQETASQGTRNGRLIEVALLKALVLQEQAQPAVTPQARDAARNAARDAMAHALHLAAGEGYVLLFLEEGQKVTPLLQAIIACRAISEALKAYARQLLEAFGQDVAQPGDVDGLVESLTPREMEVLQLIAVGHTNRAIAERLVITVRTVKKHAGNIYGKLNVSNRTQAVARARELGLLAEDG